MIPRFINYSKRKRGASSYARRSKKALKIAFKVLDSIMKDKEKDYVKVYNAIIIFLNEKIGSKKVEYSNDEIIILFQKHGASDVCAELKDILMHIEFARFSSSSIKNKIIDLNKIKDILKVADSVWY